MQAAQQVNLSPKIFYFKFELHFFLEKKKTFITNNTQNYIQPFPIGSSEVRGVGGSFWNVEHVEIYFIHSVSLCATYLLFSFCVHVTDIVVYLE